MSERMLTDGSPVPADNSHTRLRADGQQVGYVVLSPEERAKGFVKPVRHSYVHAYPRETDRQVGCGVETRMGRALAETYARDPRFYSGTFCVGCGAHFPLNQFVWNDGEPMDPLLQEAWHAGCAEREARRRAEHIEALKRKRDLIDTELKSLGAE